MSDLSLEQLALKKAAAEPSVGELVGDLTRESGKKKDAVIQNLMKLVGEKKLIIAESKPYTDLLSYAFSPFSLWFWGALAAVGLSMGLISVTSGVVLYLRYIFGSVLVLFLPGYSLIEALYPKRELDELTRFALSIGLSLALVPLIGLVLNYTPFDIRLLPVTLSIAGLTVILLFFALARKHSYYRLAKGV
ncbi:MAG: DUF1616 domain-containing protein [Nitrososphaerales archaeon]|jgi:uncharacterized membrane protein